MQAPIDQQTLMTFLSEQAPKARPVLPKDVWLHMMKKFLSLRDLESLRLTSRYLNAALTPVWDQLQLDFCTYFDVFFDHQVRYKAAVVKNNGWVYDSNNLNKSHSRLKSFPDPRPYRHGYGHTLTTLKNSYQIISTARAFGSNQYGQLAQPDVDPTGLAESDYLDAQEKNVVKKINAVTLTLPTGLTMSSVICGFHHTVILSSSGRVFSCGKNQNGQLGIGNSEHQYALKEVTFGEPIIDVAAGAEHTLFLGKSRTVYGAGRNTYGQLGITEKEYNETPVKLLTAPNIEKLFAGAENSFLIDDKGSLYVSGCNSHWQTNRGKTGKDIIGFVKVDALPPMSHIVASQYWSFGISQERRLYATGRSYGALNGKKDCVRGWTEVDTRYCQLRNLQAKRKLISAPIAGPRQFLIELTAALTSSLTAYAQSITVRVSTTFFKKSPTSEGAQKLRDQLLNWKHDDCSTLEMCEYVINLLNNNAFDCSTKFNVAKYIQQVIEASTTLQFALQNLSSKGNDWAKDVTNIPATIKTVVIHMRDEIRAGNSHKLHAEFGHMLCEDPTLDQPNQAANPAQVVGQVIQRTL